MNRNMTLTLVSAAVALAVASSASAAPADPVTGAPQPPNLAYAGTPAKPAVSAAPAAVAPAAASTSTASAAVCKKEMPLTCSDAPVHAPKKIVRRRPKVDTASADEVRKARDLYMSDAQARSLEQARRDAEAVAMGNDPDAEARAWQSGKRARPVMGRDGLLMYPYGQSQPTITCAPLLTCDVELQAGEVINNVVTGDTVRWILAPATTGEGALAVQHVIIKPTEPHLKTDLTITTNRRTYKATLISGVDNNVSRIGFYYPADIVQNWNGEAVLAQRKAEADAKRKVSDMPIASIEQLNLDGYRIKGDKDLPWYPVRVFDDGTHVWIQMPHSIKSFEAPALVLLDKNGESELVNYRVKEASQGGQSVTYYIVDKLFDRAGLILGVGREQKKVEITKTKGGGFASDWTSHLDN